MFFLCDETIKQRTYDPYSSSLTSVVAKANLEKLEIDGMWEWLFDHGSGKYEKLAAVFSRLKRLFHFNAPCEATSSNEIYIKEQ